MFAGELKETSEGSDVWQYTKELWVQTANESAKTAWGSDNTANNSETDGKANTLALNTVTAPKLCIDKNAGPDLIKSVNDYNYQWYLPSLTQLMGIWAARKSITNAGEWGFCWASTTTTTGANSYIVQCNGSFTDDRSKTIDNFSNTPIGVRCVKERMKIETNN